MLPVVTYTFSDLSSKYKIIRSQVISVILLEYTVYPPTQKNNIAQKSKWNSTSRLWSRTSKNVPNYFDTSSNLACKFVENPFTVFILQCCSRRDRQIDREADGWAYESTDGRRFFEYVAYLGWGLESFFCLYLYMVTEFRLIICHGFWRNDFEVLFEGIVNRRDLIRN